MCYSVCVYSVCVCTYIHVQGFPQKAVEQYLLLYFMLLPFDVEQRMH